MNIATVRSDKLEKDFTIHADIAEAHIHDLLRYSHNVSDPAVHDNTADWQGGSGRFASRSNFNNWYAQGRYVYTLIDEENRLSGIIWFGAKDMSGDNGHYGFTFAIRLYGRARGAGLSVLFTQESLTHFRSTQTFIKQSAKGIWLETSQDNFGAIKTYQKLGCTQIGKVEDGRILMVFPD